MNRLQKKCILGSVVLHGLLLLVILFGAAFISKKPSPPPENRIMLIPSKLVDSAGGGGGDPKVPRTEDRVKGDTTTPQPPTPTPPAPKPVEPQARATPPTPAPQPPPRVEPRRTEPRVEPVKPPKATDVPKVSPTVKTPTPAPTTPKLDLVPTVRNNTTKAKEKAEALEREARAAEQKDANRRRDLAGLVAKSNTADLKAGFKDGVAVQVNGPGGEASANYAMFVRDVYENAWQVLPDLADQDFAVTIEVTVSSTGRVVNHRIVNRSGNAAMDRSIQRAMDKVKATGLPKFPDGATDSERTFRIPFNLKAKRLLG